MEIDWGTGIVGLVSVLIFAGPFVVIFFNRAQKEKRVLRSLNEIAQQNNCIISQHEFCGDFALGLDESRNFVFFFKQKKGEVILQSVDLSEIQSCHPVKKTRTIRNGKDSVIITERLELNFVPVSKSEGETSFELYDEEVNVQLSGELQFLDKWVRQLSVRLKKKR
jgi:hypothetical protein